MSTAPPASDGGLYVHFAYCARRCVYCDFALATPRSIPADRYTDALITELANVAPTLGGAARTFYVGGGTPSLWPVAELARFLAAARTSPGIAPDAELTLEANPEEVDDAWLDAVIALGINRVSLGIQSLDDAKLAQLSRVHGRAGAIAALERLDAAFVAGRLRSYSIDLMYGLPGQTLSQWLADLGAIVDGYGPPHLSLYALTVEPTTVLGLRIRKGQAPSPDDGLQADMMFAARDLLAARGYTHYEVSSWARPGHIAQHNSAYWEARPWLGLGAGAHAFVAGRRTKNEPRPSRYIDRIATSGDAVVDGETPDAATLAFERLLTGLRRLDIGTIPDARFADAVAREIAAGNLEPTSSDGLHVRLSDRGLRFMDDVLLALMP